MEGGTTLLKESGLRSEYCFDAVQHWIHTYNSLPTDANRMNTKEAPWQSLGLRCYSFDRLQPFGTMGFVKTVTGDAKVPKSGDRGKPVVLIGYATDTPGYRFIDLQEKKIDTSVHITWKRAITTESDILSRARTAPIEYKDEFDWVWKLFSHQPVKSFMDWDWSRHDSCGLFGSKCAPVQPQNLLGDFNDDDKIVTPRSSDTSDAANSCLNPGASVWQPASSPYVPAHRPVMVGDSANLESRDDLASKSDTRAGQHDRNTGLSHYDARLMIRTALKEGATLKFRQTNPKTNRSKLRYEVYKKLTSIAEYLDMSKKLMVYTEPDYSNRKTDRIVTQQDLA